MATKKKKSDIDDDKVHVDFVGKEALFIRRVAFLTERSNNEVGKMLIGLLMKAHQNVNVQIVPGAEIKAKNGNETIKFSEQAEISVQIELGGL
jgi:hypothetical protein